MTITTIRTFESTHTELGVWRQEHTTGCLVWMLAGHGPCDCGAEAEGWFVFDRHPGEPWHMHCGPYATREEAEGWIMAIREER